MKTFEYQIERDHWGTLRLWVRLQGYEKYEVVFEGTRTQSTKEQLGHMKRVLEGIMNNNGVFNKIVSKGTMKMMPKNYIGPQETESHFVKETKERIH